MNQSQRAKLELDRLLKLNGGDDLEVDELLVDPRRRIVAATLRNTPVIIEGQAVNVPGRPINNQGRQ